MSVLELKLPPEVRYIHSSFLFSFSYLGCNLYLVCILYPIRTIKKVMSGYIIIIKKIKLYSPF